MTTKSREDLELELKQLRAEHDDLKQRVIRTSRNFAGERVNDALAEMGIEAVNAMQIKVLMPVTVELPYLREHLPGMLPSDYLMVLYNVDLSGLNNEIALKDLDQGMEVGTLKLSFDAGDWHVLSVTADGEPVELPEHMVISDLPEIEVAKIDLNVQLVQSGINRPHMVRDLDEQAKSTRGLCGRKIVGFRRVDASAFTFDEICGRCQTVYSSLTGYRPQ